MRSSLPLGPPFISLDGLATVKSWLAFVQVLVLSVIRTPALVLDGDILFIRETALVPGRAAGDVLIGLAPSATYDFIFRFRRHRDSSAAGAEVSREQTRQRSGKRRCGLRSWQWERAPDGVSRLMAGALCQLAKKVPADQRAPTSVPKIIKRLSIEVSSLVRNAHAKTTIGDTRADVSA